MIEIEIDIEKEYPKLSRAENNSNMRMVKREWNLGPDKTSIKPTDNKPYWSKMARAWGITEKQARRRFCANCEYFDNTPKRQKQMESIPLTAVDYDGGGRGYCVKFNFICHNLRTCQAWEKKAFYKPREEKAE